MTNDLFIKYEKIIYYVLRKLNLYNERDTYYDIGLIGLVKAGNTYDSSKGFEFSTYAYSVIRSEILSYIRNLFFVATKSNANPDKTLSGAKLLAFNDIVVEPPPINGPLSVFVNEYNGEYVQLM